MTAPRAQVRLLQGRRLHLQDGPIDLIVHADGEDGAVAAAYGAAARRFASVLDQLCAELPALRAPADADAPPLDGPVARRMAAAVTPFAASAFVTPMAAVAGSVADEILAVMLAATDGTLRRAFVNNGGDIALHLAPGQTTTAGLVDRPDRPGLFGRVVIEAGDGIGGIATSGAPGRSFSLGIADAVTLLARSAAEADAAATIVANAVDLPGDPRVTRRPARLLQPDSDLGDRLVTRAVAPLDPAAIATALDRGRVMAQAVIGRGLAVAAALHLQGRTVVCGTGARIAALARPRSTGSGAIAGPCATLPREERLHA